MAPEIRISNLRRVKEGKPSQGLSNTVSTELAKLRSKVKISFKQKCPVQHDRLSDSCTTVVHNYTHIYIYDVISSCTVSNESSSSETRSMDR